MNTNQLIEEIQNKITEVERDTLRTHAFYVFLDYVHYNKLSYYLANRGVDIQKDLYRGYMVYSVQTSDVMVEVF